MNRREAADKAYAAGAQAYRDGKTRLGSHGQPCRLAWCKRALCRGWRDAARAAESEASDDR